MDEVRSEVTPGCVAICDDVIMGAGRQQDRPSQADLVIDATGQAVAPGS